MAPKIGAACRVFKHSYIWVNHTHVVSLNSRERGMHDLPLDHLKWLINDTNSLHIACMSHLIRTPSVQGEKYKNKKYHLKNLARIQTNSTILRF
jgi:hypothetical protein